jgi:ribosomal-protein-alanine N-acetyltransferase
VNTTIKRPQIAVHNRWALRRDMPEVLAIENQCFQWPWSEDDFIRWLRERNVIAMVAEANERIVGFMVYELHKHKLHILNFAVHEDFRYKGVGSQMIAKLVSKLSDDRRAKMVLEVRETNLDAQLFFKRMGFECIESLRDYYEETGEDAYRFVYRYQRVSDAARR